ncbi:MAG: sulfurtransferase-like selenium metabolism protein YedF [candidate division Zixibacteria bacterium]|jgi:selenium metabolism protein YedF|nr:sulfurtransferase-like selenium metabolism protein YedF [candidate division Zixibacteria bacterium]
MTLDKDLLLILKSSGIGDGEIDLGNKLMRSFLSMLVEMGQIPARIICMNSGVFLTTVDSPVEDILKTMEAKGTLILSCGTCLDYFNRRDKLVVGQPSNMRETVESMLHFRKVITP